MKRVLVTGGLGFVGSELARTLLLGSEVERLVLVVRPQAGQSGRERFDRLVQYWGRYVPVPSKEALRRVEIVEADLDESLPKIEGTIDIMYHAAASTDLAAPLGPSRRANLYTTQRTLRFARELKGLQRFVHFSTAYVCGRTRGTVQEDHPPPPGFHNYYEQTKYEAEDAVRNAGMPYTILRPSIIVGRSQDGYMYRLKVLYSVWRMWLSGFVPRAPIDPKSWVDIVPIDYVVDASIALARHPEALGQAVHLCSGEKRLSPKTIMLCATKVFGVPVPPISPPWVAYLLNTRAIRPFLTHALREILDVMYHHLPYLGIRRRKFDTSRADRLLASVGIVCPSFETYGETLFGFCRDSAWGKRALKKELTCSA